jgi:phosphatidylglycerol:prolipoprotein diacylglycerol transferase
VFYVWQGGMSFLWWIVGVAIAIYLFWKKYKLKIIDLFKLGDLIILTLGFGIGLVRIWNFLNQELYGKIIYNILPSVSNETVNFLKDLGIVYIYQSVDTYLRINTNFLEAFFEGFLFFIFINLLFVKDLKKNSRWPGKYVGIFFMYYSIVRFIVEFLREYDKTEFIWIFTKTQRLMFVMFLIGLFFFKLFFNKRPKSEIFK